MDVNSGEEVAVKLEEYGRADYPIIDSEASLYETFAGGPEYHECDGMGRRVPSMF